MLMFMAMLAWLLELESQCCICSVSEFNQVYYMNYDKRCVGLAVST